MSQRDQKQENQQGSEEHRVGHTRKSAASAKPKAKAAASVTIKAAGKTPQQKKADQKKRRDEAKAEQRRIDRQYYHPDTKRYKNLRRGWWFCLGGAIVSTGVAWIARDTETGQLSMFFMLLAYALVIAAFYLDFSKIRKERQAYQARMLAKEDKQKKEERAAARAARAAEGKKKGSGKNASRNPKAQAKAAASKAEGASAEAGSTEAAEVAEAKPEKKGLFGWKK